MGEKYMFFDSIDGEDERSYTADEFAEYFKQFISNGILNGGDNLSVTADGDDMTIEIKPGYAWIEGYLYKIDTEPLKLTLDTADPILNRIDRIVIRLDKSLEKRYIKAFVLKGIPAESPVAPEITRNDNVYEISLARILVENGKSYISMDNIIDERFNKDLCGLVNSLIKIDTQHLIDRFEADKDIWEDKWQAWFDEIKGETFTTKKEVEKTLPAYQSIKNIGFESFCNTRLNGDFVEMLDEKEKYTNYLFDMGANDLRDSYSLNNSRQHAQMFICPGDVSTEETFRVRFYGRREGSAHSFSVQVFSVQPNGTLGYMIGTVNTSTTSSNFAIVTANISNLSENLVKGERYFLVIRGTRDDTERPIYAGWYYNSDPEKVHLRTTNGGTSWGQVGYEFPLEFPLIEPEKEEIKTAFVTQRIIPKYNYGWISASKKTEADEGANITSYLNEGITIEKRGSVSNSYNFNRVMVARPFHLNSKLEDVLLSIEPDVVKTYNYHLPYKVLLIKADEEGNPGEILYEEETLESNPIINYHHKGILGAGKYFIAIHHYYGTLDISWESSASVDEDDVRYELNYSTNEWNTSSMRMHCLIKAFENKGILIAEGDNDISNYQNLESAVIIHRFHREDVQDKLQLKLSSVMWKGLEMEGQSFLPMDISDILLMEHKQIAERSVASTADLGYPMAYITIPNGGNVRVKLEARCTDGTVTLQIRIVVNGNQIAMASQTQVGSSYVSYTLDAKGLPAGSTFSINARVTSLTRNIQIRNIKVLGSPGLSEASIENV